VTYLWPTFLWGLLVIPWLLAAAWLCRRRPPAVTFPDLDMLAAALRHGQRGRRHVPSALFVAALLAIPLAAARPIVSLPLPADRAATMLAIDVSGSMLSQDVAPSRLEAAKAAAKAFVAGLPPRVRVGLVTFAGYAALLAPPTTDHGRVIQTIDGIGVRHRTAIGDGLMAAVAALPERVQPLRDGTVPPMPQDLAPGFVVLLSDGQNNAGMDPLDAADLARREAVTVYTVGIGRSAASDSGWMIGGPLDETTLRGIAQRTGGAYYHPTSGAELRDIYSRLSRRIGWTAQSVEITGGIAAIAASLLVAALVSSALWRPLES